MKNVKRAIALSGGGPPVGIQIGALKALDEFGIGFDIFTTDCIGSWTACIYNSHEYDRRFDKLIDFYKLCFVPDKVFNGFSVPVNIFVTDFYEESLTVIRKIFDPSTYEDLLLPEYIFEAMTSYLNPLNWPKDTVEWSLCWTKMMSLNPFCRFMFKLVYQSAKTGHSWLLGPGDHGADLVDQYIDFEYLMQIDPRLYINTFNLTRKKIDLFTNRSNHKRYKPISLDVLKANSSILGYLKTREIGGDAYCEGAVMDTVNFKSLLENHPDLDEIWVINILDYQQVKPPQTQLEAELLEVELPFITIANNNIELFRYHLKDLGLENQVKVIKIDVSYQELNFLWKWSTLEKGIEVGYKGAVEAIETYYDQYAPMRLQLSAA